MLALIGVVLTLGGGQLAWLNGSLYYVLAGVLLLSSSLMSWRGHRAGLWLYALILVMTIVWSLIEVGLDAWALLPRLALWLAIAAWLLVPATSRKLNQGARLPLLQNPVFYAGAAAALVWIAAVDWRTPEPAAFPRSHPLSSIAAPSDWAHWGATLSGTRYSKLTQIDSSNVQDLSVAWTYRTGVGGDFKATPLQVDDSLYFCTAGNVVISLDIDSGAERWRFDPKVDVSAGGFKSTCRGVSFHRADPLHSPCGERIITATTDARLIALDAHSGALCQAFGINGQIDLLKGMGEVKPGYYYVTSPPTIIHDVVVLGGQVADNQETNEPSGVIRAFDVRSGELKWAWDVGRVIVGQELDKADAFTRGTPNAWSVFSADETLGLIYIPTGNATPDVYGMHRSAESERYASSIVALDASTGATRWSFQTTHHDVWDYDVPAQPVLAQMRDVQGIDTPVVIAPTKRGELFVLDRRNGAPVAQVEERAVPNGDVPGEVLARTQPFSVGMPSFAGANLTEEDAWGLTPIDQMLCRISFRSLRYEGAMTPPSLQGSLQYPGFAGGMNWGSVTVDEDRKLLVVQAMHLATWSKLIKRDNLDESKQGPYRVYFEQRGTPYGVTAFFWLSPLFIPCQRPPYGEMAVIDLQTRAILWRRPLGTANEMGPLGLKMKAPLPIGAMYLAGSITTRSGLIFVSGTLDRFVRALDVYSGAELWRDYLPGQSASTPMTYWSEHGKRQYLIVTASGDAEAPLAHVETDSHRSSARHDGGYVIAYALEPSPARLN